MSNSSSRRTFLKTGLAGLAATGVGTTAHSASPAGPVDRRRFGKIGKEVSLLGLGLGSSFYKPYSHAREEGHALLEATLAAGVNYWDTAANYGSNMLPEFHPSEEIIAPVVQKHRKDIFLVSKSAQRDYDGFRRELERSLTRLGVDQIDLFHMHNIKPRDSVDEMEKGCYKAALKAKEEGLIGAFGITGHSGAAILVECLKRFDPDALLTIFPCNRPDDGRYEDELLPLARERDMGVVGMKTVKHARNADLKGSDLIRYALGLEGVHSVIVGLDTRGHLDENVAMATGFQPLPEDQKIAMIRESQAALAGLIAPWDVPGYEDGSGCAHA
jgi:aryl-alcohol dehydrogenase-like predicted oxidoreductase